MYSVGHQLMQARKARQLSIEDVAFETRIPHSKLREMENDDLSNFANLTYAKGFLKLYSRFLNLDLSDYLDEFDTSAISDATGHEYVHTANTVRLLSAPAIAVDDTSRPRSAALGIAALTAILAGGGWYFHQVQVRQEIPSPPPPAATASASAPSADAPAPAMIPNALAQAETGGGMRPSSSTLSTPAAIPKAAIVPEETTVRKATPVDDNGNDLPAVRPQRVNGPNG